MIPFCDGLLKFRTTLALAPAPREPLRLMNSLLRGELQAVMPLPFTRVAFELRPSKTSDIGPAIGLAEVFLKRNRLDKLLRAVVEPEAAPCHRD